MVGRRLWLFSVCDCTDHMVNGNKKDAGSIMKFFQEKVEERDKSLIYTWTAFSLVVQQPNTKHEQFFALTTLKLCVSMEGSMFCHNFLAISQS